MFEISGGSTLSKSIKYYPSINEYYEVFSDS